MGYFVVENKGAVATTTWFRVLLYLSNDGVAKTSLLGTAYVENAIQPGGGIALGFYETFTSSVRGKYLIVVIDPDSRVPDSNRSNNVVVSQVLEATRR
jgi:subtilase family serine protease